MERLARLQLELEAAGKLATWQAFCREQRATSVEVQIDLAERVLAIRGRGSLGESYVAHARRSGATARRSARPYKPTGY